MYQYSVAVQNSILTAMEGYDPAAAPTVLPPASYLGAPCLFILAAIHSLIRVMRIVNSRGPRIRRPDAPAGQRRREGARTSDEAHGQVVGGGHLAKVRFLDGPRVN
jgi:hypothetical protein